MTSPKQMWSCDFETTTDPQDCHVWAFYAENIYDSEQNIQGNNIDDFMEFLSKRRPNAYFHNLKFDGQFILSWLLNHGYKYSDKRVAKSFNTLISLSGLFYEIEIVYSVNGRRRKSCKIYDSLKKIPLSVENIAHAYNLKIEKSLIDYTKKRPIGYNPTPHEWEYIKIDVKIVAQALKIQFDEGLTKMTAGADAYDEYVNDTKLGLGKRLFTYYFPQISLAEDADLRQAYRGGFTWVNPVFQGKDLGKGMVFDVNSLYPSRMYNEILPFGEPVQFNGKYEEDEMYPLFIQQFRCQFEIKKDHVPSLQIHNDPNFNAREYLKTSKGEQVELMLSSVDLKLFFDHYDVYDIEYLGGYKFKGAKGLFERYIDYWMNIKAKSKGGLRAIAKLKLNSLYGKFATNPDVTGKIPYLDKSDGVVKYYVGPEETRDPVYVPMGIFITAYARNYTIRTAQKVQDRIIYCDTDSIHITGTDVPDAIKDIVHPTKLGYWKHESTFYRGRFLRAKCYIEDYGYYNDHGNNQYVGYRTENIIENCNKYMITRSYVNWRGKKPLHVRCAGMPDRIKKNVSWENFHFGFSSYGKLVPKHVAGGTVFDDEKFTLKEKAGIFN